MNKSSMQNGNGKTAAKPNGQDSNKIVDQAKQAVTHVASDVADRAISQVNTSLDGKRDKAVETMGSVASAIRETGEKLKGVGPLADVVGKAANSVEKVADFFDGKQIGDVVRDVERFARREPALFIGAAFAVGLIGGRFLKSSAHRGESDAGILADSPSSDRGYAPPSRNPRPAAPPLGSTSGFQASTPRPPPKRFSAESASTSSDTPSSAKPGSTGGTSGSV